jgi:hypothetical protein
MSRRLPLLLVPFLLLACSPDKTDSGTEAVGLVPTSLAEPAGGAQILTSVVPSPVPNETTSQKAARELATEYLTYAAFSVRGLTTQLQFEGFSEEDAAYAVFVLNVNWSDQAAKRAAVYVEREAVTRSELIELLVYDGFSLEEAAFAASVNGL